VDEEFVQLSRDATAAGMLEEVVRLHPGLRGLRRSIRLSVNLEVVDGEVTLHDGDEVGVLPPVAGG
jgi:molybdopterin converting factor small subunit